MIVAIPKHIRRWTPFLAFNILIMLFFVIFLLAPSLNHFADRSEEISESSAQLAHFRKLARSASAPANRSGSAGDPFLPGTEERVRDKGSIRRAFRLPVRLVGWNAIMWAG